MQFLLNIITDPLIVAMFFGALAVLLACFFHYEVLHHLQIKVLDKMKGQARKKFLWITVTLFTAHTVEVWFYAFLFTGLHKLGLGGLQGVLENIHWVDFLYYSAATYTTLGIGDIYPTGALRLLTGIEAINGLMLIAWSATFFYFHMEKRWLHF